MMINALTRQFPLVNAIEFMENEADRLWREANENEKGGED